MNKKIIDELNNDEYELAKGLNDRVEKNGFKEYVRFLKSKTYPIAEIVSKMSPNELLVFEDALTKFRAVQDGNK